MQNDSLVAKGRQSADPREAASDIRVEDVSLAFPNGFVGLQKTSLRILEGEFCTLLGASGSGKTTLLRVIAGLQAPSSGQVMMGGRDVTNLPIQARNIGFVFQNYALFPHMTVAENIAYPLKVHKWTPEDREARVREILDLIHLPQVANRAVGELSGGQQQRVAIGRALSYRPSLLLLDEPMGALDRRLRQQLGMQLREIQQNTGVTAIYVTHDQEEAFILSDRVAVMDRGTILQYAPPDQLYRHPNSRFVARFLGEANLIDITAMTGSEPAMQAKTAIGTFSCTGDRGAKALVVRPEDIRLLPTPEAPADHAAPVPAKLERQLFLGSRSMLTLKASDGSEFLVECGRAEVPAGNSNIWMTWRNDSAVLIDR